MSVRIPNTNLEEIVVFTKVVQGESFTAAARTLGLPKSTVSRRIAELETRVGARLLQRTTRTLSLTDVGRVYYDHCVRIVTEVEEAQLAIAQLQSTPRGRLRVTAPPAFSVLGPIFAEYLGRYPDVQLELVCTDRRVDLVEERYDLALRAGETPDSSLIARRIGTASRHLFAAPKIATRLRRAKDLKDLEAESCIAFAPEGTTWSLQSGGKVEQLSLRPNLTVNDYEMLRSVARAGFGIALLPDYVCAEDVRLGTLRPVLASWSPPEVPVFALYPSIRHLPPKVVALLDLLRERLVLMSLYG